MFRGERLGLSSMIIAIVNDSSFKSMLEKTAGGEGVDCLVVTEEETLWAALPEATPDVLFLDIGLSTLDGASLIQKLKQNPSTKGIPIVAFGTSLRADLLQDAKEMGADKVLTKSAFREQLTGLIRYFSKT